MSSLEHWHRCARITVSTLGVIAALVLSTSTDAGANSYNVYACSAGQGTYLNPGHSAASWSLADNNASAYYLPFDQCGATESGFGVIAHSGYIAPAGDFGEVFFEAPAGLSIGRVQLWRSLYDYGVGSGGSSQRNYAQNEVDGRLAGVGDEFEGAADVPRGAVGSGDTTESGIVSSNYISIDLAASLPHAYAYVIGCGFANGCTTGGHDPVVPSGPDTVLKIYGAIVSVQDNTPPTLSLGASGLLDGATQSATAPLTLSAAAPAGIAKLELYAGASPTPSVTQDFTQSPHCAFYEAVPCQNLSNYQYQVNTADLPNGTYYITVKAYDPAGNVVAVSSPSQVTVQNAINAGAGVANGVSPCAGEALGITVNGKSKPPVIPYGRAVTVRGLLHCGSVPIRDARIVIATAGGPSKAAINSAVLTGVDGSFSYKVPKGPDRTLRFSYTAYSNENKPTATAVANIQVRPTIKLQITPHRTSNEHTIHWKGTLTAGPFPKTGVTLVVEVQEGKHWKVFDQVETNTKGQFHYNYHFHATEEPTTYTFRVALPNNGAQGYPYTPGSSNTIKIHVTS